MSSSAPSTSADAILGHAAVALARSQRLVDSWLPPPTDEERARAARTEAEIEAEERELFQSTPEVLGVGAAPLKDDEHSGNWDGTAIRRTRPADDEMLRRLIMGKRPQGSANIPRPGGKGLSSQVGETLLGQKGAPRLVSRPAGRVEDEDEDAGRSAVGKAKRKVVLEATTSAVNGDGDGGSNARHQSGDDGEVLRQKKIKRPANYLDEVLAERAAKQEKRKKKKQGKEKSEAD